MSTDPSSSHACPTQYLTFATFAASLVITRLKWKGNSAGARAVAVATKAMPILRVVQLVASIAAVGAAGYHVNEYLEAQSFQSLTPLPTQVSLLFAVRGLFAP